VQRYKRTKGNLPGSRITELKRDKGDSSRGRKQPEEILTKVKNLKTLCDFIPEGL